MPTFFTSANEKQDRNRMKFIANEVTQDMPFLQSVAEGISKQRQDRLLTK